jgi:hypothetical protein
VPPAQVSTSTGPVQVLHGVSACVPVRSLSAVLGPSGAGKSSLFDVLLGEAEMEYVDGNAPLQEKVAYVTQDAQLVVSETVLDVMWFYANLALPRHTPMAHRRQLIEDILFAMDMSHTQVRAKPRPLPRAAATFRIPPHQRQNSEPLRNAQREPALCFKGDDGTAPTGPRRTPTHAWKGSRTGFISILWEPCGVRECVHTPPCGVHERAREQ